MPIDIDSDQFKQFQQGFRGEGQSSFQNKLQQGLSNIKNYFMGQPSPEDDANTQKQARVEALKQFINQNSQE